MSLIDMKMNLYAEHILCDTEAEGNSVMAY